MPNTVLASLPPSCPDDPIAWLRLIRSRRIGPATFQRLLDEFGSAQEALVRLPNVARAAGVKSYTPYSERDAQQELDQGRKAGFTALYLGHGAYPTLLAQAPDAPPFLWSRGQADHAAQPCVALVGARNASSLGLRSARHFAKELGAAGITVVSGLARGIDAAAHDAALPTGTIAVQAGGIDVAYPKENTALFERIGAEGLRLSEHPIGLIPQARHFPQRNRIIAGLSLGVVVVEGAARSGSLITARCATDIGRDVMAVPGNPLDGRAGGCNILIRDGATLVRSATDVIEALGPALAHNRQAHQVCPPSQSNLTPTPSAPPERASDQVAQRILDLLGTTATSEDIVLRDCGFCASDVATQIIALEVAGRIERHPGGLLSRTR